MPRNVDRALIKRRIQDTLRDRGPMALADLCEALYPYTDTFLQHVLDELRAAGAVACRPGLVARSYTNQGGTTTTVRWPARIYSLSFPEDSPYDR